VDSALVEPLIGQVLSEKTGVLFKIEPVEEIKLPPMAPHAFDTVICAEGGEITVERYARVKHAKIVCIPCAEKVLNQRSRV
jgi:formylmethanofuran dehydrogenase subunit E